MKLFGKLDSIAMHPGEYETKGNDSRRRLDFFLDSIQVLFLFLREYTLDITEIDAETFKNELKALQDRFQADEKTLAMAAQFERQKGRILEHIQRQKRYLGERETEFREIIDLMAAAMTSLDQENVDFYGSIRVQGERFEEITLLNDIKHIKNELTHEVAKLREMVRKKEQQDQKDLEALSSQVEILKKELDNARHSANIDGLTGIYNRKALDHYLSSIVERNTIRRTPFSLLMMDLDDFKQLNDQYGHTVGDRVLLAFTEKCRQLVRSDDFLARYGGEEFMLVLPGASLRNATKKAKRLCRTVATSRYAADDTSTPDVLSVTVSIGVACFRKGDSVKCLIERADQCLYKAKATGKNRVVSE